MGISNSGGGHRVGGWFISSLCKKELAQLPTFCIARYVRELVVEFFNISSCFCPLGLLFVTCRSSAALPLPPPSPPPAFCPSVAEPPCRTWEGLRSGNMPRGEREKESERERALSKKLCCLSPLRSTMPCSCSTRPPTDTEVRWTDPAFPLQLFLDFFFLYSSPTHFWLSIDPSPTPLHPPSSSFLWAELQGDERG